MNLKSLLSDGFVERIYLGAGAALGDALSYGLDVFPGDGTRLSTLVNRWAKWEEEYSRRGFRTIDLERFVGFGGYGEPVKGFIGQRREEDEKPILYAKKYRDSLSQN